MARITIPNQGDIVWLDFNPTKGHEQKGHRPALVVSPKSFNKLTGLSWVVPITSTKRGHAFEVDIKGVKETVTGVAITHQIRSIDYKARHLAKKDKATPDELQDVLDRLQAVIK